MVVANGGESRFVAGFESGLLQEAADVNRVVGGAVGVELDGDGGWGGRGVGEVEDEGVGWWANVEWGSLRADEAV